MVKPKRILIAGGGIAGPSCALLLARGGHRVTIVERARHLRATGQQIDVAGKGVDVVKHMGIWDALKERSVGDAGIKFVDQENRSWADFPVSTGSTAASFVKEIEILRGDMVEVIYERTRECTEYMFGDQITAVTDHGTHATVSFERSSVRDFDIVIAADGLYSRTRDLVFGKSAVCIRSLDQCAALMSIPWEESDGTWSRWCNAPGGRCATTRPRVKEGLTGAYLAVMTKDSSRLARMSVEDQKHEFAKLFADMGWEAPRMVKEMMNADDFYVSETAQTKVESWARGRVALLGDAGYCPSPVSGQGTTLAFVGAYVLAGCINSCDEYHEALSKYEEQVKPFVDKAQQLITGVPGIANPQTGFGIRVFYSFLWIGSLLNGSRVAGLLGRLLAPLAPMFGKDLELPHF